jgi:hypothetical protein
MLLKGVGKSEWGDGNYLMMCRLRRAMSYYLTWKSLKKQFSKTKSANKTSDLATLGLYNHKEDR